MSYQRKLTRSVILYYGSPQPLTRPRDDASRQLAMTDLADTGVLKA